MKKLEKLEMVNITKSFHKAIANNKINLTIKSGEIIGLLGENGAGKTTLMNILYGLYQPDSGEIKINGKKVNITSPHDSIRQGIGMVHQHFMLIQNHSVIENIALSYENTPILFPQKKLKNKIIDFSNKFNFKIEPFKKIWQLSAGEQQRVEIIKVLLNGVDLIILDEPTSVLSPQETKELFAVFKKMKDEGHMIILISHKLDEIMDICDRVIVLQKGSIAGHAKTMDMDKKSLARMMIGRDVLFNIKKEKIPRGTQTLCVNKVTVMGDKNQKALKNLSFNIYKNEIFGIAGVAGNGQRELVEAITGMRAVQSGKIFINEIDITNMQPRSIYDQGVSHIPEERIKFGIAPGLFLYDNAILKQQHLKKFTKNIFLEYKYIKDFANSIILNYQVATPSINIPTKNLSGGNIQKLILGREISDSPSLLVASHPTYGLDVGATEYLRKQLLQRRKEGGAVLLVSEDLEEIFELCDRIAVIFQGEFMGILNPDDPEISNIGLMMAGSTATSKNS